MFSIDFDTCYEFAVTISNVLPIKISIINYDEQIIYGSATESDVKTFSNFLKETKQIINKDFLSHHHGYTIIPIFHINTLICYIYVHQIIDFRNISDINYIKTAFKVVYENYIMRISKFSYVERSILINKIVSSKNRIVSSKNTYDSNLIKESFDNLDYDSKLQRAACLIQFPNVHTMEFKGNAFYDYILSQIQNKLSYHSSQDIYGMLDNDKILVLKAIDSSSSISSGDILLSYAEDISKSLKKNNGIDVKIGIGSIYSGLAMLQSSFDEANSMLETLYGTNNKTSVAFIQDNIEKYILSDAVSSNLGEYFKFLCRQLGNNNTLFQTITAMVNNDMNLIKTANYLGIHRNTVSLRLEKINSIIGTNPLNSIKDRSLFYLFSLFLESKITLRLGTNTQKTGPLYTGCFEFAKLVREMSDNKINISISTAADVAYKKQMAEALRGGTLDFALCSMYHMSEYTNGTSKVLDLPFLFKDDKHAERVLNGLPGKIIAYEMEKLGIISLGYLTQGWRVISNDTREVRVPEDIKDMKIRIRDNDIINECFKSLGAIPVKSEYGDLLAALKQKIIDGQDNPYINFYSMGYGDYQHYITETNHNCDVIVMAASKSAMSKLTVTQRDIIIEAAKLATKIEREKVRKMNSQAKNLLMADGKIQIEELTELERKQWLSKVEYLYKNCEHEDLLNAINDLC